MGGGLKPRSVEESIFQQDRLYSLSSRNSAAYKAVHALLMRHGCQDFISGKGFELMSFYNDKVDVHHVFPKAWCKKAGISPKVFNAIVNKTPLSNKSNILISGDAPSIYLKRIETKHGLMPERLDEILRTHLIEPEFLRSDNGKRSTRCSRPTVLFVRWRPHSALGYRRLQAWLVYWKAKPLASFMGAGQFLGHGYAIS